MRSIVACPGCRRRLRLTTDQPGKKLRCPACQTPFVLGARTNPGVNAAPEFVAFELLEENIVSDGLEIVVDAPPPKRAAVKIIRIKPSPLRGLRRPPPRRPSLEQTGDIIGDGFEIVENKPLAGGFANAKIPVDFHLFIDGPRPSDASLIPDDVGLLDDDAPKPPPKPETKPKPKPPPVAERKPAPPPAPNPMSKLPAQDLDKTIVVDFGLGPRKPMPPVPGPPAPKPPDIKPAAAATPPRSKVVSPPAPPLVPPVPSVPPAPPAKRPLIPADNFEISLVPPVPQKPAPKKPENVAGSFEIVRNPPPASGRSTTQKPPPIEQDFEIIARPPAPRSSSRRTDVPVIQAASDEDVAASAAPDARRRGGDEGDEEEREYREWKREQTRRGWTYVFWGVTAMIVSMGMTVLALALMFLGVVALGAASDSLEGAAGGGIVVVVAAILLMLQEIVALAGYGMCLGAPTRANARGWAIATMILAVVILLLQGANTIGVPYVAHLAGLLSFAKWFCFLFFLKAVGEGLRERWIEDEVWSTLKLALIAGGVGVLVVIMSCGLALILGVGIAARGARDPSTMLGAMGAAGIVMLLMFVIIFALAVVVWVKYLFLLLHVRGAVRARLER